MQAINFLLANTEHSLEDAGFGTSLKASFPCIDDLYSLCKEKIHRLEEIDQPEAEEASYAIAFRVGEAKQAWGSILRSIKKHGGDTKSLIQDQDELPPLGFQQVEATLAAATDQIPGKHPHLEESTIYSTLRFLEDMACDLDLKCGPELLSVEA